MQDFSFWYWCQAYDQAEVLRSFGEVLANLAEVLNSFGVVLNNFGEVLNSLGDVLKNMPFVLNSLPIVLASIRRMSSSPDALIQVWMNVVDFAGIQSLMSK